MELEALIQHLTREILNQLSTKVKSQTIMIFGQRQDTYKEPLVSLIKSNASILFLDDNWKEKKIDRYVLPLLTLNQMGDLVQGMARGRIAGEVLGTILLGQTVEVVEYGYTHYLETAPEPLLRLYEAQKETLKGFGIKEFEPMEQAVHRTRSKVVTQAQVQAAGEKGAKTLRVPDDACITPLALEAARENSIVILKK